MIIKKKKKKLKGIKITEQAVKKINNLMKNKKNIGIRLSIIKSGCAGFKYLISLNKKKKESDIVFFYKNINIFIIDKYINFLDGTKIDFIDDGINKNFKFTNSRTQYKCGCGESFNI
ncbi:iron-sulfur cluster assembly accessory protein [Buchnera aphidicola (Taiwanaphis decaspermi)]|uniref:HesB/IscA family protein n=1 Tax=Buchnera aphidicola TaxID=9 RepID=UPI0031B88B78